MPWEKRLLSAYELYDRAVSLAGLEIDYTHVLSSAGLSDRYRNARVLEIGTGRGELTEAIVPMIEGSELVGLDFDELAEHLFWRITSTRKMGSTAFHLTDLRNKPPLLEVTGSFDLIITSMTLHNLSSSVRMEVYRACHGMLASNGRFICIDKCYSSMSDKETVLWMRRYDNMLDQTAQTDSEFSAGDLRAWKEHYESDLHPEYVMTEATEQAAMEQNGLVLERMLRVNEDTVLFSAKAKMPAE